MRLTRIIAPRANVHSRRPSLALSGRCCAGLLFACLLTACQPARSDTVVDATDAGPSVPRRVLIQQDVAAMLAGMHHADIVLGSLDQGGTPKASQPAPVSR
jgi:hypothetical protein